MTSPPARALIALVQAYRRFRALHHHQVRTQNGNLLRVRFDKCADLGQPKDGGRIVAICGNADDAITQAQGEQRLRNARGGRYNSRRLRERSQRQQ